MNKNSVASLVNSISENKSFFVYFMYPNSDKIFVKGGHIIKVLNDYIKLSNTENGQTFYIPAEFVMHIETNMIAAHTEVTKSVAVESAKIEHGKVEPAKTDHNNAIRVDHSKMILPKKYPEL